MTMFRKPMAVLATTAALLLVACNSLTGPAGVGRRAIDKVCLDDLRAVEFTNPGPGQSIHAGEAVVVAWEAREFCSIFDATLQISLDNGATYETVLHQKGATSKLWQVPGTMATRNALFRVTLEDALGTVQDELATAPILADRRRGGRRDPAERD